MPARPGPLRTWSPLGLLLVALVPSVGRAQMGMGNTAPVVDAVSANPALVSPGAVSELTCSAHDPDGQLVSYTWTATAGTFPGGVTTVNVAAPGGASVAWTAPATLGVFVITCRVHDNGGPFGGSAWAEGTVTVEVSDANLAPRIDSLVASEREVFVGGQVTLIATISDPDSAAVTATWSATGGGIAGDQDATPAEVVWTAPARAGDYVVTVTARDDFGASATSSVSIRAVLARPLMRLTQDLAAPTRLALRGDDLAVADLRRRELIVLNALGRPKLNIALPGTPTALAATLEGYAVALRERPGVLAFDRFGRLLEPLAGLSRKGITDLHQDPVTGGLFVTNVEDRTVSLVQPGAGAILTLSECAPGVPLVRPVAAGRTTDGYIQVLSHAAPGVDQVCVYEGGGGFIGTYGRYGSGLGRITQGADLNEWTQGRMMVVDVFQGEVRVFDGLLQDLGSVGRYGNAPGELRRPMGVAADGYGRIFVSSTDAAMIEVFAGAGYVPPVKTGDGDFDDLPDAWELANGLDPSDPRDFALDPDGDGLLNLEELEYGTDPQRADSDGDGVEDGWEVAAGTDPLDPSDQRPVAAAGADQRTPPDLVVLDGSASSDPNGDALTYRWAQVAGPPARLGPAQRAAARPSLPLTAAGVYVFSLEVSDGKATSPPAVTQVTVENVAPLAAPAPEHAVAVGAPVALRGRLSADANGDAVSATWQVLSTGQSAGPDLRGPLPGVGREALALTVTDGALVDTALTHVVLLDEDGRVPRAEVAGAPERCLEAEAGETLHLRAVGVAGADYAWSGLAGPPVIGLPADGPAASVTLPEAGVYELGLEVSRDGFEGTPAHLCIVADAPDRHVPRAALASRVLQARVLDRVLLDASGSSDADGDALACTFEQRAGARLVVREEATLAEVVPLWPGLYRFEVRCTDGLLVSAPAEVELVVDSATQGPPRAQANLLAGSHRVGAELVLTAQGTSDPQGEAVHFLWAQTAGPWVRLTSAEDRHGPGARSFRPPSPGRYAFTLHVHDGTSWGLGARVTVRVGAASGEPAPRPGRPAVGRVPERARRAHEGAREQREPVPAQELAPTRLPGRTPR